MIRAAIYVPNFGEYADPAVFLRLARATEASGWDGLFVWDHVLVAPDWGVPIADAWTLLAGAATVTERIRLGPLVTPLPRRRPWVVARQAVTLDWLSGGRLILGAGLGAPADAEFAAFGEDPDPGVRAEKLDEALAILVGLWSGDEFSWSGRHFRLAPMRFEPPPIQRPRIPLWIGGYWPHRAAFERAARWDGVFPASRHTDATGEPIPLDELAAAVGVIRGARPGSALDGYEVVVMGESPSDRGAAAAMVAPYVDAGATWWCETLSGRRGELEEMLARVAAGPPRAD
jgi:alkanesulfonate monooxygenase SsuD/methylene tetrahydromethanopterin reductase-like flavin-dependent oxidoreductase (luciferase family)